MKLTVYKRVENSRKRAVRLNRKQLARMFDCVPSQINYTSTRFSAEEDTMLRAGEAAVVSADYQGPDSGMKVYSTS